MYVYIAHCHLYKGAFTPDANDANKSRKSWTFEHFEFTRFIRARNLRHSRVKFTTQQNKQWRQVELLGKLFSQSFLVLLVSQKGFKKNCFTEILITTTIIIILVLLLLIFLYHYCIFFWINGNKNKITNKIIINNYNKLK